jgi:hypothetical protein
MARDGDHGKHPWSEGPSHGGQQPPSPGEDKHLPGLGLIVDQVGASIHVGDCLSLLLVMMLIITCR